LTRYMPALRSYLVFRKRIDPHKADDLLQGFLLSKVIEQDLVASADRTRGKFPSFLVTALNRYMVSQSREETAQKRGGGGAMGNVSLDEEMDAEPTVAEGSDQFDVAW